jgi:hypothetical protein
MPKRKKKGKKGARADTITLEESTPVEKPESHTLESEVTHTKTTAVDSRQTPDFNDGRRNLEVVDKSIDEPTHISPTRLAKHTFFHTSEVSQSLPVRIDHPLQSDKERIDHSPQPSVDVSMIETLAKDIPRPIIPDAYTPSTTEQFQQAPATTHLYNEPATWSFDNLEPPVEQKLPEPSQEMQSSDPFVSPEPIPKQKTDTAQAEPISPVDSTTKDRTSYLFQSPVDLTAFDKAKDLSQEVTKKQTRFHEPRETLDPDPRSKPQTPPAPLPPSPSQSSHVPLPPMPARVATPPAPLPPSPSRQSVPSPVPFPPNPHPVESPPLTRKKSLYDIGSPGPGHSLKAARRTATPQQPFRDQPGPSQVEGTQAVERDSSPDRVPVLRSMGSNLSILSSKEQLRPSSSASNHSVAPSLRRINRSLSGDLRAASSRRRDATHGPPTTIPIEPPPTPPLQDEEFNGHGAFRPSDMANIYVGDSTVSEM